ncbi:MAG: hypothetical protein AB1489_17325, partial [Acidobacteriota bacterium]
MKSTLICFLIICLFCGMSIGNNSQANTQVKTQAVQTITFPRGFLPSFNDTISSDSSGSFAMATSLMTGTVFIFNAKTGEQLADIALGAPTQVSLQGDRAAVIAFARSPQLTLLDISNPSNPIIFNAKYLKNRVYRFGSESIVFSRDGRWLFTPMFDVDAEKGFLISFDARTGDQVGELPLENTSAQIALQERNGHRFLAISSGEGILTIVDATDPRALRQQGSIVLPGKLFSDSPMVLSDNDDIGAIGVPNTPLLDPSDDGEMKGALVTFNVREAKMLSQVSIPGNPNIGSIPTKIARQGNRLIVSERFTATITTLELNNINTQPPRQLAQFTLSAFDYSSLAISLDGNTGFAVGFFPAQLFAFDMETGTLRSTFPIEGLLALSTINTTTMDLMLLELTKRQILLVKATPEGIFEIQGKFVNTNGVSFGFAQQAVATQDGTRAYIPSRLSDEILELSPSNGTLLNRIKTGSFPVRVKLYESPGIRRMAVNTIGNNLFNDLGILGLADEKIDFFVSINGGAWQRTATVGPFPILFGFNLTDSELFFSKDGKTGFISDANSAVYAINTDTGEILSTIPTNSSFTTSLVGFENDTGKRFLALIHDQEESLVLTVIDATDPANMMVLSTANIPEDIFLITNSSAPNFSSDGGKVYFSDGVFGNLVTIDSQTGQILSRNAGSGYGLTLTPFDLNGKRNYTSAGPIFGSGFSLLVQEEDPSGNLLSRFNIEPTIDIGIDEPAVTKDGKRMFVRTFRPFSVMAISTETGAELGYIPVFDTGKVAVTPVSNRLIAPELSGNQLFFADTNSPTAFLPSLAEKPKSNISLLSAIESHGISATQRIP